MRDERRRRDVTWRHRDVTCDVTWCDVTWRDVRAYVCCWTNSRDTHCFHCFRESWEFEDWLINLDTESLKQLYPIGDRLNVNTEIGLLVTAGKFIVYTIHVHCVQQKVDQSFFVISLIKLRRFWWNLVHWISQSTLRYYCLAYGLKNKLIGI